jgi:NADH:ubiquinone oxidoreductase subunit 4 (subunit M)
MLSLLLLTPIIGSLLLLTIPENTIENKIRMKRITLISMIINFLISIYI